MVRLYRSATAAVLLLSSLVSADGSSCSRDSHCPQNLPCCSQYGQCGVGAYCLGGCDPFSSHSLDSCMPAPICRSQDYKFDSLDGLVSNTEYLGDASKANWVVSGTPKKYTDGDGDQVLLTLAEKSVGTLLASTSYVWYGKISATMKTSRTQGVVTAFILLADSKDEIDFEFVGNDLDSAQSNFYSQGIPYYHNGKNLSVTDTFGRYHTYEIDWKPDSITWSIDGKALRTQSRKDTWNSTSNSWNFPQSPARIQLSLWPAGAPGNAPGTIEWAGGVISWDTADVHKPGYYYAMVKEVKVECYDPPPNAKVSGSKSYTYSGAAGTNDTVVTGSGDTVMKSFLDTGLNPNANAPQSSASAAPSSGAASDAPTIPGVSGGGVRGGGDSGSGGGGSPGSSGSSSPGNGGSSIAGFSQGLSNTAPPPNGEKVLQGSMLAVLVAIVGVLLM